MMAVSLGDLHDYQHRHQIKPRRLGDTRLEGTHLYISLLFNRSLHRVRAVRYGEPSRTAGYEAEVSRAGQRVRAWSV
jgi:hypothetical protein